MTFRSSAMGGMAGDEIKTQMALLYIWDCIMCNSAFGNRMTTIHVCFSFVAVSGVTSSQTGRLEVSWRGSDLE